MRGKLTLLWCWLLGVSVGFYLKVFSCNAISKRMENVPCENIYAEESMGKFSDRPTLQFAIVTCFGRRNGSQTARIWTSQLRQLRVLFKSIAVLTSSTIQINIVSPMSPVYNEIAKITSDWPANYRRRITFGPGRRIFYPRGLEYTQHLTYRRCATAKLFLPAIFKDMDALIVLDNDVLFMQPPEDLWEEFGNFERRQISGIAPCLARYGRNFTAFPAYGFSGLNTGVVLMNLTRMRSFRNGWVSSITDSFMKYRRNFTLSDQDILTNFFSEENSKFLYELGCEWNYRATVCQSDWNKCAAAASRGVALLHGCDGTFRVNKEPAIKAVFQAWERYQIGSPIKGLVSLLEEALSMPFAKGCIGLSNIKDIFLKGLKRHLARKHTATAGEGS